VHISLEVHNVTIQVVSLMEFTILIVSKVMSIHIPLGSPSSPLWCIFEAAEIAVGVIANSFAMKCLKLISIVLDLPQFFLGVDHILKHVHLLFRAEMGCCINKRFIESNLLLPIENKAM